MKRNNSQSTNRCRLALLGAAALAACSAQNSYPTERAQCLKVLQSHTAFAELTDSKTSVNQQRLSLLFKFNVSSAFGPKAASGECSYSLSGDVISTLPLSIQIGRSLHTDPASIAELVSGRHTGADGYISDQHDH